jgi:hypothetical protein
MRALSLGGESSLSVGIENSLVGALARAAGARPSRPGGAFVADHSFRFDLEGRRGDDPAWRTDDDFGASPAGTVRHGKCLKRGFEPPVYGPRQVGRPNKLAPYLDFLRERIAAFPDLTAVRLTREIRERGYSGAYTAVKRFIAAIRPESQPKPFGAHTPIQRCQIHKARNVVDRLPKSLHVPVRRAGSQAWEPDDVDKAERLLRNLARRLDQEAPGVAASLFEGLDEMLTVNRLGLPTPLRRSLACTNSIENMIGTVRRVSRNVKRWQNAAMALRWTAAGMMEAAKGFRRSKAYKQLPVLKAALIAHANKQAVTKKIEPQADAA